MEWIKDVLPEQIRLHKLRSPLKCDVAIYLVNFKLKEVFHRLNKQCNTFCSLY